MVRILTVPNPTVQKVNIKKLKQAFDDIGLKYIVANSDGALK